MYFALASVLFLVPYVLFVIIAYKGLLFKSDIDINKVNDESVYVNLIIVFKNEASNLPRIIESIKNQSYLNFKVIWVDDNSDDCGISIIENSELINKSVIVKQKFPDSGKKSGVEKAIWVSDGELLLFSDADCFMNSDWIATYVATYHKHGEGLYFGAVQYDFDNFLQKLFAVEFSSLVGIGLGLANAGVPVYFNGANYALSSSLKSIVNYSSNNRYVSGDDVFLLHYLKRNLKKHLVRVVLDSSALVYTKAPLSVSGFVRQRIRWGGKTKGYTDFLTLLVAFDVFILALWQIVLLFLSNSFVLILIVWGVKFIVDTLFLCKVRSKYKTLPPVVYSLALFLVYPFYIVFAGLAGVFATKDKWLK